MNQPYLFFIPLILGMAIAFVASALFVALSKWLDGKEVRRRLVEERQKLARDLRASRDDAVNLRKQLRPLQNTCEAARYYIQGVPTRYGNPDPAAILNELNLVLAPRTERTAENYVRNFQEPSHDDWNNLKSDMKRVMQGGEREPA